MEDEVDKDDPSTSRDISVSDQDDDYILDTTSDSEPDSYQPQILQQ